MTNKEFDACLDYLNDFYEDSYSGDEVWFRYFYDLCDYYDEFNRYYDHRDRIVNVDGHHLNLWVNDGKDSKLIVSDNFERYLPTISELLTYFGNEYTYEKLY